MKQHVDIGREIVVENRRFDKVNIVVEVLRRPEICVVDGDYVVVGGEVIGEVRADEPSPTGHENTLIVHG